MYVVQSVPH